MHLIIKYEGEIYVSADMAAAEYDDIKERLYDHSNDTIAFKVNLATGSTMIIGSDVIKRAVFLFVPDTPKRYPYF